MAKLTSDQIIINNDIMRYKKNKWAQLLALLGLVFNCLYFMLLYAYTDMFYGDLGNGAGKMLIGVSVILTLISLLAVFLASENVKNYRKSYSIVLLVIAGIQILRIFGFPLYGLQHDFLTVGYFGWYPTESTGQFIILTVYLCASAACLIAAAIIGWIKADKLERYMKTVESGDVDIIATIKKVDAEEEATAQTEQVLPEVSEEVQ